MLVNALRGHMAEFGIIAPQGLRNVEELAGELAYEQGRLPELARSILQMVVAQLDDTTARAHAIEVPLAKWHKSQHAQPFAGDNSASASWAQALSRRRHWPFRSGREFAAWLGMTPRQNSSGGKERLGRTSKRGDKYIRCLLISGAVAVLRHTCNRTNKDTAWVRGLLARRPTKVTTVALANKSARIAWVVMTRGEAYRSPNEVVQPAYRLTARMRG